MDLRRKIKRKNTALLIAMILLLATFIALFCMFGLNRRGIYEGGSAVLLTLIYAYGLYKSKLIEKLCDKDHDAVVVDFVSRMEIIPVGRTIRKVPVYDVSFESEDGKKYVRTYKQTETDPRYYRVGSRVHYFRYTRFPIKYGHGQFEVICPICGKNAEYGDLIHCTYCDVTFSDI